MQRGSIEKRRIFASFDVTACSERTYAWDQSPRDDFDSECSFDSKDMQTRRPAEPKTRLAQLKPTYSETDDLREKLGSSERARLKEEKAKRALKDKLDAAESRTAELEKLTTKQQKDLLSKAVTVERLEQHIARLEEQTTERDTQYAEMVKTQSCLASALAQQATELKGSFKKAEDQTNCLQEALSKVRALEDEVQFLRDAADCLREELRSCKEQANRRRVRRSDSGLNSPRFTLADDSFDLERNTEFKSFRDTFECEVSLDQGLAGALENKEGSFLDGTGYGLTKQLLPKECIYEANEELPTGIESELRAKVSALEKQLAETTTYWLNQNKVLQEYIDELRQLLSHFKPLETAPRHRQQRSVYERITSWIS
jgi:chromosome segregation ATPase